jgi:tetratricopeptide (TPR) repeat protein
MVEQIEELSAELEPDPFVNRCPLEDQGRVPEARAELVRADTLQPEMPETLYSLGKAASLSGDNTSAEKAWIKVVEIEKESDLAAQAHFALAGLYRKQGKTEHAEGEMEKFKQLHHTAAPLAAPQK